MLLDYAVRASIGRRSEQQDAIVVRGTDAAVYDAETAGQAPSLTVCVADGMGGQAGGAMASRIACAAFMAALERSEGDMSARLAEALRQANKAIAVAVKEDKALTDMGTTLLGIGVDGGQLHWASSGDTHLFLLREGTLLLLNADHSAKPQLDKLAAIGSISRALAKAGSSRLGSALMGDDIGPVDVSPWPFPVKPGDMLVAATDGIDTLEHEKLETVLSTLLGQDAASIAHGLLAAVAEAKDLGQDNTTVCVIKVVAESETELPAKAEPPRATTNVDA